MFNYIFHLCLEPGTLTRISDQHKQEQCVQISSVKVGGWREGCSKIKHKCSIWQSLCKKWKPEQLGAEITKKYLGGKHLEIVTLAYIDDILFSRSRDNANI